MHDISASIANYRCCFHGKKDDPNKYDQSLFKNNDQLIEIIKQCHLAILGEYNVEDFDEFILSAVHESLECLEEAYLVEQSELEITSFETDQELLHWYTSYKSRILSLEGYIRELDETEKQEYNFFRSLQDLINQERYIVFEIVKNAILENYKDEVLANELEVLVEEGADHV